MSKLSLPLRLHGQGFPNSKWIGTGDVTGFPSNHWQGPLPFLLAGPYTVWNWEWEGFTYTPGGCSYLKVITSDCFQTPWKWQPPPPQVHPHHVSRVLLAHLWAQDRHDRHHQVEGRELSGHASALFPFFLLTCKRCVWPHFQVSLSPPYWPGKNRMHMRYALL